jgi:hypothetical protein
VPAQIATRPRRAQERLTPQQYGLIGARRRWGEPRVVRLDDLTTLQRRLVLALIDAVRSSDPA